jgi:molybdenum cofactor cytidylyltransferase
LPAEGRSIAGILLAAGVSSRMGENKLLLEVGGEPLVRRAARRALEAALDPVVVVVGHDAERVSAALDGLPCTIVPNPSYRDGASGSLHRGLESVPTASSGAVVVLPDMPHVTAAMLGAVREAAISPGTLLVTSRYGEVLAPPHFFHRSLFPELLSWTGEGAGRGVVSRHLPRAIVLEWAPRALLDLDTPADVEASGL